MGVTGAPGTPAGSTGQGATDLTPIVLAILGGAVIVGLAIVLAASQVRRRSP